jgi:hypothetical protein
LVDVATLPVVSAEGGARSAPASPQPSSVAAQPASDIFATLEKLAELHGKGILSDEEFASKKAELLSRVVWEASKVHSLPSNARASLI